jgi:hypothetical protein
VTLSSWSAPASYSWQNSELGIQEGRDNAEISVRSDVHGPKHHGIKELMQEGGARRRDALAKALSSVGGSLESFYYACSYYDVLPGAGTVGFGL